MDLNQAMYKALTEESTISSLISTRVYPKVAPQKPTYPLIVLHRIGTAREVSQDGPLDLADAIIQINCVGRSSATARQLASAVRLFLDGYRGSMGGVGGVVVNGAFVDDERDEYDDDLEVHVVQLDVGFLYNE